MAGAPAVPAPKGTNTAVAKKRRRGAAKTVPADAEESWANTVLNPPPIPASESRPAPKKADSGRARKKRKTPGATKADHAAQTEAADEDSDIGGVADWNWADVTMPTYISLGDDDIGGVMSLQEIDGVDCVWEDDETTGGRVLKFCKGKASKRPRKRGKTAAPERAAPVATATADSDGEMADLDDGVNWDDFVLVDDFSEEKAKRGKLVSIGTLLRSAEAEADGGD
ncbi:hypothetical protein LPJ61_003658, partial [Coemansia biformis]